MGSKGTWKVRAVAFMASQCVTLLGSSAVQLAMAWYVAVETSSGTWTAALLVAGFVPQMLVAPVAGAWVDRKGCRKAAIIGSDAGIAATTLILVLALSNGVEGEGALLVMVVASILRSVGAGIQMPAVGSAVVWIVPKESLMRYNGINTTIQSAAQFAAPIIAGLVLSLGDLRAVFMTDIATAIIGIAVLCTIAIPDSGGQGDSSSSLMEETVRGIRYARDKRPIARVLFIYGTFIFLSVPSGFMAALLLERMFDASYGMIALSEAIGCAAMILGGVAIGAWGGFRNRRITLSLGVAVYGVSSVVLGLAWSLPVFLAGMAGLSFVIPAAQSAATTILQEESDPAMMGRVFGLMGSLYAGLMPLGSALFGPLADVVPMGMLPVGCGILLLGVGVAGAFGASRESCGTGPEDR